MKKILILGGTGFVGRILTEELLRTNTEITLFNRGITNPGLFPGVKRITGNRQGDDILQVVNTSWDVVIDFTGFYPDNVEMIVSLLEGKAGRYIFISTGNVYSFETMQKLNRPIDESVQTDSCTPEQAKEREMVKFYGNKKAECERILLSKDWLDVIILRPSLIYGRYDPTDRFYYWLYRAMKKDRVLLPEDGRTLFTNTYAHDLAKLIQEAINIEKHRKVYNASTHQPVSIREFLKITCSLLNTSPEILSAPAEFLDKYNVAQWQDIAMWINGFDMLFDNSRLREDFKTQLQPFEESVKNTIEYYSAEGWKLPHYGLTFEKEDELLGKLSV
jgi:2'-hydroxyisoflavone reductase